LNILKLVTIFFSFCSSATATDSVKKLALTFDDPNTLEAPLFSSEVRDQKIRNALALHNIKAALFVCGKRVDSQQGSKLLQAWALEGHTLANHSYSHLNFNSSKVSEEEFEADFLKGQSLIEKFESQLKLFRFPFLKEGNTAEKRDTFRRFLEKNKVSNGYVTIDASDWAIDERLQKKLVNVPNASLEPYKKFYLKHILDRAQFYQQLAVRTLGYDIPHTLLLHHKLLNALFLDDLITEFKKQGWSIETPEVVFSHPIYKRQPNTVPAGESLVWALAKETGRFDSELRYPGEDETYERAAMDAAGL
jgi:peptidoglycan/xylan/chitin deacetylase (PgdA/CDA1 family)